MIKVVTVLKKGGDETVRKVNDKQRSGAAVKNVEKKPSKQACKEKLREDIDDLTELVKKYYSVVNKTGRPLSEKIAQELSINKVEANQIAQEIEAEYQKIVKERRFQLPKKLGQEFPRLDVL